MWRQPSALSIAQSAGVCWVPTGMGWMDMDEFDPDEFVFQSLYFYDCLFVCLFCWSADLFVGCGPAQDRYGWVGWMWMNLIQMSLYFSLSLYFVFLRLSFCLSFLLVSRYICWVRTCTNMDEYDVDDSTSHRLSKLSMMHDDLISCVGCTIAWDWK